MKVYAITLGFCPARLFEQSMLRFYATSCLKLHHIFLDQHYPINEAENSAECKAICARFGIEYIDGGKNLGLHRGFNSVLERLDLQPDDVVIGYDPDSSPCDAGWDYALMVALREPDIGWATLMNPRSKIELDKYGFTERRIASGDRLFITHKDIVNSICAWSGRFLKLTGGLTENRPYYGHLESPMWAKLCAAGLKWAFLAGYNETDDLRAMHDFAYTAYKWEHAHMQSFDGSFAEWLAAGSPRTDPAARS